MIFSSTEGKVYVCRSEYSATTPSIMTLSITTFSIMILSITTFSIMTLSIKTFIMTLSITTSA
jgi:hypothetical protein